MLSREISAFACFPNQPLGAPDKQVKTFLFRRGIQTLDSVKCEYTSTLSVSSMSSLTPCLWGQWLHLHHFFVVNNYTYSTPCLCGHWLHLHCMCLCGQWLHLRTPCLVVIDYTYTVSLWSMTTTTRYPRGQQKHGKSCPCFINPVNRQNHNFHTVFKLYFCFFHQ